MMCKLKGQMDNGGHDDMQMKGWMPKGSIMMCKLKGWMDKRGHYVEIKGWIQNGYSSLMCSKRFLCFHEIRMNVGAAYRV